MQRETADLVVIGGGITGAGVAYAAARRGLSVMLLEAQDFVSGTSSRSTKLVHGGLRYLAMGDVRLVRESALERKSIQRIAPHLAVPAWMLLPARSPAARLKWRLAIGAYERLGAVAPSERHRTWTDGNLKREEPALAERFRSANAYREYRTDDARPDQDAAHDQPDREPHGQHRLLHAQRQALAQRLDDPALGERRDPTRTAELPQDPRSS